MNKFLRISLMALLALVFNTTFAADAYKTLTFPDDNNANNHANSYTETWEAIIGTDSWEISNFNNFNWEGWTYIRCGSKKAASVATIATKFAMSEAMSSVVVTIDKITASYVNSISLVTASDAAFNNVVETVNAEDLKAGEMVFNVTKPEKNLYYKLVFDCALAKSNGIIQISKVAYYEAGNAPEIVDISNTPETAYTVAKAHELTAAGEGLATSVYVKGIVTEITEVSAQYGNATYYINDTNSKEGQMMVYRGKYFGGENFTSEDQLKVGDEVVVYGQLSVYNNEHQIAQGNQIYSINGKTEPEAPTVDITNTPETAYTVAKANELIAAGEGLDTEVYVKGIITEITEVSAQYGNATYYINDTESTDGQLCVFRGKYLNGEKFTSEDQIKVGDEVIVYGQLVNYGGTYEINSGNQLYSINGVTTGINKVEADTENVNAPAYNLAGQRVNNSYKGIIIKNGKKYINNK